MSQPDNPRQPATDATAPQPAPRGEAEHRYADRLEDEPADAAVLPGRRRRSSTRRPPRDRTSSQPPPPGAGEAD